MSAFLSCLSEKPKPKAAYKVKCQTNKALDEIVIEADKNNRVTACRELSRDKKEVRLYCHSEAKKQGILTRFTEL